MQDGKIDQLPIGSSQEKEIDINDLILLINKIKDVTDHIKKYTSNKRIIFALTIMKNFLINKREKWINENQKNSSNFNN